ncbi:TPA: hypothetical protein ACXJQO_004000 [Serratia marcescens]|uniref:hypothetical protein n=1 Tax=Serratia TaxID=613 RepID=UPI00117BBD11|nr:MULTISPECIES: hypothetical protein [Serratia]MBH3006288.1 hypothetical protein [Serratia ureilytica]MBH3155713.1 hypothetical protein [Serratia ureilytica]MBH3250803.1 hypothetical protein [Serratia ureilytica]MDK7592343.1 hypothetical protein [Serratia ureilytica]
MITIGVSNGAPASRGPDKSVNRSLMGGKEIIADSAGFLRHYLFIGMSKYVGGIYFLPSEPFPYYYFCAKSGDHTPSLNLNDRPLYRSR